MKKCNNCNKTFSESGNYCPDCGLPLVDVVCPNCGKLIEDENAVFCSNCGSKIDSALDSEKSNVQKSVQNAVEKLKENEFVKSVKNDFQNSQSVSMIKDKVKDATNSIKNKTAEVTSKTSGVTPNNKKKIGVISGIVAVVIVLIAIVSCIHICDECDKTYLGIKHTVTFWGETENLCKDCYDDFYR